MLLFKIILLICGSLHAQELLYIPDNVETETVNILTSTTLYEPKLKQDRCQAMQDLIDRSQKCMECTNTKLSCPDCCLATRSVGGRDFTLQSVKCSYNGEDGTKITGTDIPANSKYSADKDFDNFRGLKFDYTCSTAAFRSVPPPNPTEWAVFNNYSPGFYNPPHIKIPESQKRGCPGLEIDTTTIPSTPKNKGCILPDNSKEEYWNSAGVKTHAYDIYVQECVDDANNREKRQKELNYCLDHVCVPATRPVPAGSPYLATSFANNCNSVACQALAEGNRSGPAHFTLKTLKMDGGHIYESGLTKSCVGSDGVTASDCALFTNSIRICLNNRGTACENCFKEVYPNKYQYKFMPKSNQKIVLVTMPIIQTVGALQNAYF